MASLYDSSKVRAVAKAVDCMVVDLDDRVIGAARETIHAAQPLEGKAAAALEACANALAENLARIYRDLESVRCDLDHYASALEAVDDQLKTEM